jgi:hypothetical protein
VIPYYQRFMARFPDIPDAGRLNWTRCWNCGPGWAITPAPVICARQRVILRRAWRGNAAGWPHCKACRASVAPLPGRFWRYPPVSVSRFWTATSSGCWRDSRRWKAGPASHGFGGVVASGGTVYSGGAGGGLHASHDGFGCAVMLYAAPPVLRDLPTGRGLRRPCSGSGDRLSYAETAPGIAGAGTTRMLLLRTAAGEVLLERRPPIGILGRVVEFS